MLPNALNIPIIKRSLKKGRGEGDVLRKSTKSDRYGDTVSRVLDIRGKRGEERNARNPAFDHVADIKRLVVTDTMHYIIGMPVHKQRRLTMNEAEARCPGLSRRPLPRVYLLRVHSSCMCERVCMYSPGLDLPQIM